MDTRTTLVPPSHEEFTNILWLVWPPVNFAFCPQLLTAACCFLYLNVSSWPGIVLYMEEGSNNLSSPSMPLLNLRSYNLEICISLIGWLSQLCSRTFSFFIFFQFIWSLVCRWSWFASAFLLPLSGKCTSVSDICLRSSFVNYEVMPDPFINKLSLETFRSFFDFLWFFMNLQNDSMLILALSFFPIFNIYSWQSQMVYFVMSWNVAIFFIP